MRFSMRNATLCLSFADTLHAADEVSTSSPHDTRALQQIEHRAHVAHSYRPREVVAQHASAHETRGRQHRRLAQRSSVMPSTHRLLDDVAVDECRPIGAQRFVYDRRSRQVWAARDASMDGVDSIGGHDVHAWLKPHDAALRSRFCLEVDGQDERGAERVAWKHCATVVGGGADDGSLDADSDNATSVKARADVHRHGTAFVHQQWEWSGGNSLRSLSVDKCLDVRGAPSDNVSPHRHGDGGGGGEYGTFIVGSVVVSGTRGAGDETSAHWSRSLPHAVLSPCDQSPYWEVALF